MKKLFTLFAAAMVAIAANAATTPVSPGVNSLQAAVTAAAAGDILELGDGVFYEEGNFDMNKNLTIKAAEGAKPVIANRYYFRVEGGADITFQGLKFDGAGWRDGEAAPLGASDHCVRSHNNSTGEEDVVFEDCEFTGYPSYILYTQRANRRWNSITISNCYFYNNKRSAVYINNESGDKQSCNALTVENSTFANFADAYDVIYYNAPDAEHTTTLNVDHCTFYGHSKRAIYWQKSENLAVSNCIFAQPSAITYKSVECVGGTIKNCLSYNTDGFSTGEAITLTDNITEDPLFIDAANADYSLGEGSPALTAATDGSAIGDPRWAPKDEPIEPEDITLYLKPTAIWDQDGAKFAVWDITHSTWSEFMTLAEGETDIYTTTIAGDAAKVIFVRLNSALDAPAWNTDEDKTKVWNQTGDLDLEEGMNLFTITDYGAGLWSLYIKYEPVLENGFYLVGTFAGVSQWDYADLSAEKKFVANPEAEGEYMITVTLTKDDLFKAIYLENDEYKTWYPDGQDNDYVVTEKTAGEAKTIYFSPTSKEAWGNGHFFVAENDPTAINRTEAATKAHKCIENGQLLIRKNGKTYNAIGVELK